MTAAKATAPRYVAGHSTGIRVTLTRELPLAQHARHPSFLGEHDGTPIVYKCLAIEYVAAIRRGLAERGAVIHDVPSSWMTLATAEDLAAETHPDEFVQLRKAVLAGRAGGAKDGAK